ncbi:uncharacterized protein LOC133803284 [Humulus lupulus]|uniref:uncharacterized protein LOC133803284 n=1 Tax=Humulus lupulus TaxID=3486 RepID=UPI002B414857|nr:uncharacterized protein LOC133803284 [Humulus lupulus]XP_062097248.1 uncharacterized protein LOC133803284 [Humulus lupulus]
MGFTATQMSLAVIFLGSLSFILGIVAENRKPQLGTPIHKKNSVICTYPSDPSVTLGYLSFIFLVASTVAGYCSVFYPYKGKSVPQSIFFRNKTFIVFFNIALLTAGLGAALTLWPTIEEQNYHKHKAYPKTTEVCPTSKMGVLGGGAFLSLDSCLLWLVALMIAINVREDFFENGESESHLARAAIGTSI